MRCLHAHVRGLRSLGLASQALKNSLGYSCLAVQAGVCSARVIYSLVNAYGLLQLLIALLACENLALLVLWSVSPQQRTPATLAAQAIGLLSCLVLQALSYYEHCYSAAPSMLISLFLVFTIVFDAVHVRTLWLMSGHAAVSGISCAALGTKLLLLCVESWNKQGFLTNDALQISVELRSSLFGKALFLWLNRTLLDGTACRSAMQKDLFRADHAHSRLPSDSPSLGSFRVFRPQDHDATPKSIRQFMADGSSSGSRPSPPALHTTLGNW